MAPRCREGGHPPQQIQALDHTQPGLLPIKPGKAGTTTHDYVRNGTTTLFAALDVLDGTVLGRCMQRHRHQEFLRFLNTIERAVPAGKLLLSRRYTGHAAWFSQTLSMTYASDVSGVFVGA